ncbi:putative LRR receptor-like serine/threonine-protein kinase [Prunus yedoensis var. nudiflora]|uniref:Putative LRR receptor-like serine/threonine-protein kinase n=1 Tax=Prunus yedoensis var. nudiflora TaxID=2094558 RepID=A0A314XRB6_PRUYE|nr:putative LRR receptor-like serine/threonine-protein kinase [Prunus yedoensis var. nudiflora]
MGNHNIATECLDKSNTNFSIKCGGPQMRGNDGILYEAEDSALGPATFNVTSTQKLAVSNAGFSDNLNQSFVETTLTQVSGADLTPELFETSRVSPASLRYYGLGLQHGPYIVTLQFAETVFASRDTQTSQSLGRRVFDIYIQGDVSGCVAEFDKAIELDPRQQAFSDVMNFPVLQFDCSSDVTLVEEQFLIMKPKETITRVFKLYPATDQAAKYVCAGKMRHGSDR